MLTTVCMQIVHESVLNVGRNAHENVLGVGRMFTQYTECRKNVRENVLSVEKMFTIRRRHMS